MTLISATCASGRWWMATVFHAPHSQLAIGPTAVNASSVRGSKGYDALPESIIVREIRRTIRRKGCGTQMMQVAPP